MTSKNNGRLSLIVLACVLFLGVSNAGATAMHFGASDILKPGHGFGADFHSVSPHPDFLSLINGNSWDTESWIDIWDKIEGLRHHEFGDHDKFWFLNYENRELSHNHRFLREFIASRKLREWLENVIAHKKHGSPWWPGGNEGNVITTPLPAPLALFGSGLATLLLAAARRKAKTRELEANP